MPQAKYPSETADRFIVRFPDRMRDRIAEEAKKSGRSMNAEIVHRLEQSFAETHGDETQHLLAQVRRQLTELEGKILARLEPSKARRSK